MQASALELEAISQCKNILFSNRETIERWLSSENQTYRALASAVVKCAGGGVNV